MGRLEKIDGSITYRMDDAIRKEIVWVLGNIEVGVCNIMQRMMDYENKLSWVEAWTHKNEEYLKSKANHIEIYSNGGVYALELRNINPMAHHPEIGELGRQVWYILYALEDTE